VTPVKPFSPVKDCEVIKKAVGKTISNTCHLLTRIRLLQYAAFWLYLHQFSRTGSNNARDTCVYFSVCIIVSVFLLGKDKKVLIDILSSRTVDQRQTISNKYKERYNKVSISQTPQPAGLKKKAAMVCI
jgi:hypothetical protein